MYFGIVHATVSFHDRREMRPQLATRVAPIFQLCIIRECPRLRQSLHSLGKITLNRKIELTLKSPFLRELHMVSIQQNNTKLQNRTDFKITFSS
jgi:hypothetical protein